MFYLPHLTNFPVHACRHDSDSSDTTSTDPELTWGGKGKFEYSQKVLPHAVLHFPEIVMRAGHHGGACSFLNEVSHKDFIKRAARLGRTYGSHTRSEKEMLKWTCRDAIYIEAARKSKLATRCVATDSANSGSESDNLLVTKLFTHPLPFMNAPIFTTNGLLSRSWENCMISRRVRVTRRELLTIVCSKLEQPDTREARSRLMQRLTWTCSGVLEESRHGLRRKFVGLSSSHPRRRDFVRIEGSQDGTCLSAEIIMFVVISGFDTDSSEGGFVLPKSLVNAHLEDRSVEFVFIRWLSPHPNAVVRDNDLRPICPPPLDINHALWTYSSRTRGALTTAVIRKHISYFHGDNDDERERSVQSEIDAYFDLIQPECLKHFINCTRVNMETETHTILETITLPFQS